MVVTFEQLTAKKHRLQEKGSKILSKVEELRRRIAELEDDYNTIESYVRDVNDEIENLD